MGGGHRHQRRKEVKVRREPTNYGRRVKNTWEKKPKKGHVDFREGRGNS